MNHEQKPKQLILIVLFIYLFSASEFDRGCLRPMVSTTIDGTPTFLPIPGTEGSSESKGPPPGKTRQELMALDERELISELVKDICNDLDVRSLCHKILKNVSIITNADRCSLFLVKGEKDDPNRYVMNCDEYDYRLTLTLNVLCSTCLIALLGFLHAIH